MTPGAWVVMVIIILVAVGLIYLSAERRGHTQGWAHGYAAGQRHERRAMTRAIDDARQRGLAAQRDVDYLYGQARQRIDDQS